MAYVGIDPGSQGAICLLDPSLKMIVFKDFSDGLINVHNFLSHNKATFESPVGVEQVRSLPGMSAKSNFSFGRNVGQLEIILEINNLQTHYVLPKFWQQVCGIKIPKGTSSKDRKNITANRALELYPFADLFGPKGGLKDGRSDALMIAHYMFLRGQ